MSKHKLSILLLFFIILNVSAPAQGQSLSDLYSKTLKSVRNNDLDFAFMYMRSIISKFPDSKHAPQALFGLGEYYFNTSNYPASIGAFKEFARKYPDSKARPFALAYLLKMAKKLNARQESIKGLQKEIVAFQQVSLLFRDFKELEYNSIFGRSYKLIYFIDKFEFYIDGEIFEKNAY